MLISLIAREHVLTILVCLPFRKNEPLCRPHSWHSSKVSENSSEVHETEDTAVLEPVWQTKCDAG